MHRLAEGLSSPLQPFSKLNFRICQLQGLSESSMLSFDSEPSLFSVWWDISDNCQGWTRTLRFVISFNRTEYQLSAWRGSNPASCAKESKNSRHRDISFHLAFAFPESAAVNTCKYDGVPASTIHLPSLCQRVKCNSGYAFWMAPLRPPYNFIRR